MKKFKKALAATMLTAAVLCTAGFISYNGNQIQNAENMNSEETNGHDYVDLGLPSGTLWATCNVGANTPESNGDYFAWGETITKTTCDWSTYKYANGDKKKLTKYCYMADYGNNGFTDKLTMLQTGDDAATAKWGKGWRTPTKDDWQELIGNTTSTWTTQNGAKGLLFTASNGRSLFLPAAGFRGYDNLHLAGSIGCYWSSSLYTDDPSNVWDFSFSSNKYRMSHGYRSNGQSVRAVHSARQN